MVDPSSPANNGIGSEGVLFAPGEILDERFEILHPIGEGGWATIYLARQCLVDRLVAVKVLTLSGSGDVNRLRDRFTQEARAAARVKHPHIVTIHDVGFVGPRRDRPYIAMEYLEGHDLETELERTGGMSLERALRLILPCIQALGVGHGAGIIHRDMKPSNLFIVQPGTLREKMVVLDFGIAQVGSAPVRLTEKGELFGTPAYLAPEWITHQQSSAAIDVYQMGLILAEMVRGRPLVDALQPYDCLAMHVGGNLPVPDVIARSPLGPVLDRAIAVDPAQRFPDCASFYQALLEPSSLWVSLPTLSGDFTLDSHSLELAAVTAAAAMSDGRTTRPGMTLPPHLMTASGVTAPAMANLQDDDDDDELLAVPRRRGRVLALLTLAAVAIVLGLGGWLVLGGDDATSSARGDGKGAGERASGAPTGNQEAGAANSTGAVGSPAALDSDRMVHLVYIDSRPQGARVSIGDEVLGTTPLEAWLPAGLVELEFRRRGFRNIKRSVEVEEGLRVNERLRKRSDEKDDEDDDAAGASPEPERIPVLP